MKFIRVHITIILIIIMSILCLCAIGVAINISLIMIQRRDQVVKVIPVGQSELNKNKSNAINIGKLKVQTIIFNGIKYEGVNAYLHGKEDYLVPADLLLDKSGIKFKYFDSDNIMEWEFMGKKISVKLGDDGLWLGKNKLNLGTVVTAGENHILVPIDLFTHLDGYTLDKTIGNNTVFLNYYPEYSKILSTIKALSQNNGNIQITDTFGKKIIWKLETEKSYIDSVEPSGDGSKYLLKSGEKVYLLTAKNSSKPFKINVNPTAHWSIDGKYLYWIDTGNRMSYLYDTEKNTTKNIGDYYLKINPDYELDLINADILFDYKKSSRYERIAFTNKAMNSNYSFIKRNGKIIIEGNLLYSPNKEKVVYYVKDKGYYFAFSDGTQKAFLGIVNNIRWINNNKFFVSMDNQNYIVTNNGETITLTDKDYRLLGQAQEGELFFSVDDVLYSEKDGIEKEIKKLPWDCDGVFALSIDGPFIAVSNKEKSIYFIDKENITKIGSYKMSDQSLDIPYKTISKNLNISYSPDGKYIAFYQEENSFLSLNIFNTDDLELKNVVLNFNFDSRTVFESISTKWITNSLMLIYSDSRWCAVDIKDNIKVFQQTETKESTLYGIFDK